MIYDLQNPRIVRIMEQHHDYNLSILQVPNQPT